MALKDLMNLSEKYEHKIGMSEERLKAQLTYLRQLISFFREYPDYYVDFMIEQHNKKNDENHQIKFKFYYYQRVFLRIVMRHRWVYATFPRAYSKSFLSVLVLMLRCIFFPGADLFVTTGGKEQAASITLSKVEELCRLLPFLANEINWERGMTKKSKDDVCYVFKNGSKLDILAAKESSRGQRRTGGLMEECVLIDKTALNEIVIPTTNVNRNIAGETTDPKEVVNKSQVYITTAGWKNSFAYEKLIELLIQSIIDPDNVMIIGGTYETPVNEGLLDADFVNQLKLQDTYNEDSFDREYRSKWSGDVENAFFSAEKFDRYRVLKQPEHEHSGRSSKSAYYVLGVDVGRFDCTTEVLVFKVTPQPQGPAIKSLVNIYTLVAEHFEDQAINLKRIYNKYQAKRIAIDANGVGAGLVDYMVKAQVDPETNEFLPPFGVENDEKGEYKKYKTSDMEEDAMFLIKANAPLNTEMYAYAKVQMINGKIKFLIDESQAKANLMTTKVGQSMSIDQRNTYLRPFVLTTVLREQMLNLVQENEGLNIILKQSSKTIKKDKFSAFIYGLYYIKQYEDSKHKRKKVRFSDYMFYT
jgi:hypothetical protein